MDLSIFLARLIGPLFLIIGFVIVADPTRIRAMGRELLQSESVIFLAGMLSLVTGLAIVNAHNLWVADWRVLITLLGWISLAAGIVRMGCTALVRTTGGWLIDHANGRRIAGVVAGLLCHFLSYQGYIGERVGVVPICTVPA
mgnify:CR=1 FL=1